MVFVWLVTHKKVNTNDMLQSRMSSKAALSLTFRNKQRTAKTFFELNLLTTIYRTILTFFSQLTFEVLQIQSMERCL